MAVAAIRAARNRRKQRSRDKQEQEEREQQDTDVFGGAADAEAPAGVPERLYAPPPVVIPDDPAKPCGFFYFQPEVKAWYSSTRVQVNVAVLIMINFVCNVLEKELDPHGTKYKSTWRAMEHSFNAIFLLELLINGYGNWLRDFWCSSWNIFDCIVVAVGCVSFVIELEGPLKLLRTLRAFRVFRLFKRIKSLNKIIVMIVSAVPGVTNAFVVMVLTLSIYALIAVEFFSTFGIADHGDIDMTAITGSHSNCSYKNIIGKWVPSVSARGLCYGDEYYGTFTRAWFTLFQCLTGESWAEVVARPVLFGWAEYGAISVFIGAVYFITFVVVNSFILFNVFVAVLLDKIISQTQEVEVDFDDQAPADAARAGKVEPAFKLPPGHPAGNQVSPMAGGYGTGGGTGGEERVTSTKRLSARERESLSPSWTTPRTAKELAELAKLHPKELLPKMAEMYLKLTAAQENRDAEMIALNSKLKIVLRRIAEIEIMRKLGSGKEEDEDEDQAEDQANVPSTPRAKANHLSIHAAAHQRSSPSPTELDEFVLGSPTAAETPALPSLGDAPADDAPYATLGDAPAEDTAEYYGRPGDASS